MLLGAIGSAGVVVFAAVSTPVLTEGSWPYLMGGVVVACALTGGAFDLCLHELAEVRHQLRDCGPSQRPRRRPVKGQRS